MSLRINDNGIDRDMTLEEIQIYEEYQAETDRNRVEREKKAAIRAAALAKLGLTADEITALFG